MTSLRFLDLSEPLQIMDVGASAIREVPIYKVLLPDGQSKFPHPWPPQIPYKDFPTLSNAEFHRIGSRKRSNAES